MSDSFDALSFFGGSHNRVTVFEAVAAGTSDRNAIQQEADVNRVTAGRILTTLTEFGWIERRDDAYELTPLGEVVADALQTFEQQLTAAATLDGVLQWLPLAGLELDVAWLADATVITPERSDPQAALRRAHETVREATDLAMLSHAFTPAIVETVHQRVTSDEMTLEIVVTDEVFDILAGDADLAPKLRDLAAADGATLYRYDDDIPHILAIADEVVSIGVDDDQGRSQALLEATDERLHDWATDAFDRYRNEAVLVGAADIST